jgi:hypothetical protein
LDVACEDTTPLPAQILNCLGSNSSRVSAPHASITPTSAEAIYSRGLMVLPDVRQGRREEVGAGGVSRSKRLARAFVVCARGSMRVSELAAEAGFLPTDRRIDLK